MNLDKHLRLAKDSRDVELDQHYSDLDNFDLRSGGWLTEPLDNVKNDFVSGLVSNYLEDLATRQEQGNKEGNKTSFVDTLRKTVKMDQMTEVVAQ